MSVHDVGLQKLLREPERLRAESERINEEMETLVSENYRVFVDNLTCTVHLQKEDKKLQDIFCGLSDQVNLLNKSCTEFKDSVQDVVSSHKRIRRTLQCHLHLLELLELPQLVESCARNGSLDEALELATFVRSLERRHSTNTTGKNSVIKGIVNDVVKSLAFVRRQLMMQVMTNVAISKQVYIVATLRKLDGILADGKQHEFSEIRRMIEYLEARSLWMQSGDTPSASLNALSMVINVVGDIGAYGKAVELLESRRTSLYTVITQFRALFSEIDVSASEEVLRKWITHQVMILLQELQGYLRSITDGSAMKALMEQAIFFAKRLSDEGADFTSSVLHLFSKTIFLLSRDSCTSSFSRFFSLFDRDNYSTDPFTTPFYVGSPSKMMIANSSIDVALTREETGIFSGDLTPPSSLLAFPPLCHYLNNILSLMTFLRACPLLCVFEDIKQQLVKIGWDTVDLIIEKAPILRAHGLRLVGEGTKDFIKGKQKQTGEASTRLDVMYAEAVAFNVLPHMFISFLVAFRNVDFTEINQLYESFRTRIKAGDTCFLCSTVANCETVFGSTSFICKLIQSFWQRFKEYNLISISISD